MRNASLFLRKISKLIYEEFLYLKPQKIRNKSKTCGIKKTEVEIQKALQPMQNNQSPGNDGLSKELYEIFWNDIKYFLLAVKEAYCVKQLPVSLRQLVIKRLQKKVKDLFKTRNLYLDAKLISKALTERLIFFTCYSLLMLKTDSEAKKKKLGLKKHLLNGLKLYWIIKNLVS